MFCPGYQGLGISMNVENDHLHKLPLDALAKECAEETRLFYESQYDDSLHCFELFRRAICDKSNEAYEKICEHYIPLIKKYWVAPHLKHEMGKELDFGFDALEKLRKAFDPDKDPDKFDKFQNNIKPLMAYLKMCVNSVIVDQIRMERRHNREVPIEGRENRIKDSTKTPEENMENEEKRRSFWAKIEVHLHDDKDKIVVDGLFKLGLKPRDIYEIYKPSKDTNKISFTDVDEIYRIKQNIIARLRHDSEIGKFLGKND